MYRKPRQPNVRGYYQYQAQKKNAHGASTAKKIHTVSVPNEVQTVREATNNTNKNQPTAKRSMHGFTHIGRNLSFGIYLLTERKPSYV